MKKKTIFVYTVIALILTIIYFYPRLSSNYPALPFDSLMPIIFLLRSTILLPFYIFETIFSVVFGNNQIDYISLSPLAEVVLAILCFFYSLFIVLILVNLVKRILAVIRRIID